MSTLPILSVPPGVIGTIYQEGTASLDTDTELDINGCAILQNIHNPKQSALVHHIGHDEVALIETNKDFQGLTSRDASQAAFMAMLDRPDVLLNVATGSAGTGKTVIAMHYALDRYLKDKKRIILCKPLVQVGHGDAIGTLPGDVSEKMAPYMASFDIILKKLFGKGGAYLQQMQARGDIEFLPLELIRGCTFEHCTLILDEAANCDWHELNTLISRMGEGSKLILTGDLNQVDRDFPRHESGLWKLVQSPPFQDSEIASHVTLKVQYRSPICKLAADVDDYLYEQEHNPGADRAAP